MDENEKYYNKIKIFLSMLDDKYNIGRKRIIDANILTKREMSVVNELYDKYEGSTFTTKEAYEK